MDGRPKSIAELTREANEGIHWNTRYPLKIWLTSVNKLRDKALEYQQAGRNDIAFILMARAATIIIQKLPTHPEYSKVYSQQDKVKLAKTGEQYIKYLTALRERVEHDIARWTAIAQAEAVKRTSTPSQPHRPEVSRNRDRNRSQEKGDSLLTAALHELQVHDTRRSESPSTDQASVHHTFEYPKMPDARDYMTKIAYQPPASSSTQQQTDHDQYGRYGDRIAAPSVPQRPMDYNRLQPRPSGDPTWTYSSSQHYRLPLTSSPSPAPSDSIESPREQPVNNDASSRADPMTRRKTGRLLSMRVPSQLISKFLNIAQKNTKKRVETLGLLLGTEHMQYGSIPQLVVEVLLIPKQTGTSDTCAMLSEEEVLAVSLERGLDCLGWIHTHPTQSCFMSSMDLHTHASYQQMLPEAIAIVCAPSQNNGYRTHGEATEPRRQLSDTVEWRPSGGLSGSKRKVVMNYTLNIMPEKTPTLLSKIVRMSLLSHTSAAKYFSSLALHSRRVALLGNKDLPPYFNHGEPAQYPRKDPKGKKPVREGEEEEVDDREWELRVGCPSLPSFRLLQPRLLTPTRSSASEAFVTAALSIHVCNGSSWHACVTKHHCTNELKGSRQAFIEYRKQAQESTSPSRVIDLWYAKTDTQSPNVLENQLFIHVFPVIRAHH
ncbi:hypothetical protein QFC19_005779 [Naganishia cerealis]|uniref:Uncharacterized protein n=1 Tax=Naganishia cerealis TaxID=610337 RepID=A0ACC2VLT5_9TREE|nr:hypothetical protein QFC19_005779 [Naganishia cerealis]